LNEKTTTQTFRLDEGICKKLAAEAEAEKISLNALVGHVLDDYVTVDRFAKHFQVMRLSRHFVTDLFELISEEDLKKIGAAFGKRHLHETISAIGMPLVLESYVRLMEKSHWAKCRIVKENHVWTLHLRHDLSMKWSLFLSEYASTALQTLGYRNIEPLAMSSNSVTMRLSAPE
jgi:hypothetical protein